LFAQFIQFQMILSRNQPSASLLEEMATRLRREFEPEQIVLFGSCAWGHPTEDSDIDICVIVPYSTLSPLQRSILAHRLLRGLGVAKDVIVKTRAEFEQYSHVKGTLEYAIATRGKILYDHEPLPA
jgi:uncharacterized protein